MSFRKGISRLLGKGKGQDPDKSIRSSSESEHRSLDHGVQPLNTLSGGQFDGIYPIEAPSRGQRAREAGIILLSFVSAVSEATDLLKPVKAVSECIRQVLELAKVSACLPT